RLLMRSCSLGETTTQTSAFHTSTESIQWSKERKGLPRERRITIASYEPHSVDQNGNIAEVGILKHQRWT
ncbi:hypothetical protein XENOCAPTIV_003270, partial [Xenoophorus captivus]